MADSFEGAPLQGQLNSLRGQLSELEGLIAKYKEGTAAAAAKNDEFERKAERRVTREERVTRERRAERTRARGRTAEEEGGEPRGRRRAQDEGSRRVNEERKARERNARAAEGESRALVRRNQVLNAPQGTRRLSAAEDIAASGRRVRALNAERAANLQLLESRRRAASFAGRLFRQPPPGLPPGGQRALPPAGATGSGLRGPIVPPAPTTYERQAGRRPGGTPSTAGLSAITQTAVAQDRAAAAGKRLDATQKGLGTTMRSAGREIGLAGNNFRRNGVLTTEFITAAARGQVTLRELGFQAAGVIAKFGGWTAAAGAVFAVVGAMHQLGTGATQAHNGVKLLQRIIPNLNADKAQQSFRDLSHSFNLPIDDVAQAAYGMAKVFGNVGSAAERQNNTFAATRAALYAVKVGELDATDATNLLSATVRGFGLNASDLNDVMDTVNATQNRFGGNTRQTLEGVAKAAGSIRASHGSYRQTIALITTLSQLTGRPGGEAGTAISRSAANLRRPEGIKRAEDAGLKVKGHGYFDIIKQAAGLARGAGPERVEEIARALVPSGGQFTRFFTPLLQNFDQFQRRLLKPSETKGSAYRELQTALGGIGERAKSVTVNLARLGSALGQSGLLTPVLGVLGAFSGLLSLSVRLAEVWTQLPKPFRDVAATIGVAAAGIGILRRFNVGASLGSGQNLLSRNPRALRRANVLAGLGDEKEHVVQQRIASGQQYGTAVRKRDTLIQQKALASELGNNEKAIALQTKITATEEEMAGAKATMLATERQVAAVEADRVAVAKGSSLRGGARHPDAILRERGLRPGAYSTDLARPGASPVGTAALAAAGRGGGTAEFVRNSREAERAIQQQKTGLARAGLSGRALQAAVTGTAGSTRTFASGMRSLGAGVGRMATSLGSALGPLDYLLVGLLVGYEAFKYGQEQLHIADARLARVGQISADPRAARRDERRARGGGGVAGAVQRTLVGLREQAKGVSQTFNTYRQMLEVAQHKGQEEVLKFLGYGNVQRPPRRRPPRRDPGLLRNIGVGDAALSALSPFYLPTRILAEQGNQGVVDRQAQQRRSDQNYRGFLQTGARLRGAPIPLRTFAEIDKQRDGDVKAFKAHQISRRELTRRLLRAQVEYRQALDVKRGASPLHQIAATARIAFGLTGDKHGRPYQDVKTEDLATTQAGFLQASGQGLHPGKNLARARQVTAELLKRRREGLGDVEFATELKGIQDNVGQAAQDELDRALKFARSKRDRDKAYEDYRHTINRQLPGHANARKRRELFAEGGRAQFELEAGIRDARTQAQVAGTADPVAQARIQLRHANAEVGRVAKQYGRDSKEYFDAIGKARQARQQEVQAALASRQAGRQAATAKYSVTHDEGQVLARNIRDAAARIRDLRAAGKNVSPDELKSAEGEYWQAVKALRDYRRQQAEAMIQANAAFAAAGTTDPVREAAIKLRAAIAIRRHAPANDPAGRRQQEADIRQAREDQAQAIRDEAQGIYAAQQRIAIAGTSNPVAQARIRLRFAVGAMRRFPPRTRRERYEMLADIAEARQALAEALKSEAENLIHAQAALYSAGSNDPVKEARGKLIEATRILRLPAATHSEFIQRLADYRNARQAYYDAQRTEAIEDLQFRYDVGKLTKEQLIQGLQAQLRLVRNNKEMRRQIMRQIYQLQHEDDGNFDLNPGDVRLPTIYDIRRAIAGGAAGGHPRVNVTNSPTVNVSVGPGGAQEVGRVLDRTLGTATGAAMRNAGL